MKKNQIEFVNTGINTDPLVIDTTLNLNEKVRDLHLSTYPNRQLAFNFDVVDANLFFEGKS